jgi:hypothetical protein
MVSGNPGKRMGAKSVQALRFRERRSKKLHRGHRGFFTESTEGILAEADGMFYFDGLAVRHSSDKTVECYDEVDSLS